MFAWQTIWDTSGNSSSAAPKDLSELKFMPFKQELEEAQKYLRPLRELIGPPPPARKWEDDWPAAAKEYYEILGAARTKPPTAADVKNALKWQTSALQKVNWRQQDAETFCVLAACRLPFGRALKQRDPCYAASTYAMCDALFAYRVGGDATPKRLYCHIRGSADQGALGLWECDSSWDGLETPNEDGFRGLTCSSVVLGFRGKDFFTRQGFSGQVEYTAGNTRMVPMDCDVVCFDSAPQDERGHHSAILLSSEERGAFPPNTMFELKEVCEPGTWECPVAGLFPNQRLLVVLPTYGAPRAGLRRADPRA